MKPARKVPVTETAKTLVALNNCWSFLVFAAVIPALLLDQQAGLMSGHFAAACICYLVPRCWELLIGSLLHFLCLRTQKAEQYKMALVIGSLMLTLALAQQLKIIGTYLRRCWSGSPYAVWSADHWCLN